MKLKWLVGVSSFLAALLVYVPVRLIAEHTHTAFWASTNDFASAWAVLLYPAYFLCAGLLAHGPSRAVGLPWWFRASMSLALLPAWVLSRSVDDWQGMGHDGRVGLRSWTGVNSTLLSVVLCPVALLLGGVVGEWGGRRYEKRRSAKDPCPACGYDLRGSGGACPECGAERVGEGGM